MFREMYEIYDQALVRINSCLSDKLQRVHTKGTLSDTQGLGFGVPQGSVLGPILYCLFTKPVSDIVHFVLLYHSYAVVTQVYIAIKKQYCFAVTFSDVKDFVSEIKLWMERNMLKLFDDKTVSIVFRCNVFKRNVCWREHKCWVYCSQKLSLKILE